MRSLPRSFKLLGSASAIALTVAVAPVDIQFRAVSPPRADGPAVACDSAPPHAGSVSAADAKDCAVCQAAARLGLEPGLGYQMPLVVTLSRAQAKSGGGSGGGGSGGGGSGGGGSGAGGGSGGGGSGGGGSGGGSGGSSDSGASGASSGSESGGGAGGHDVFGGVEQVGSDLSASQEAEAIGAGWK